MKPSTVRKRSKFPRQRTKNLRAGQKSSFYEEGYEDGLKTYKDMTLKQLRRVFKVTLKEVKEYPSVLMQGRLAAITELGKRKKEETG